MFYWWPLTYKLLALHCWEPNWPYKLKYLNARINLYTHNKREERIYIHFFYLYKLNRNDKICFVFFSDRLIVYLFKDVKDSVKGASPKSHFPLDGFYGLESGICFDKETSVLAIICQKVITLLAFESRETLIQFEIKIRRSLGEGNSIFVALKKWLIRKFQLDCLMIN